MKSIILIGYMGAGKTTVGRHLAQKLGRTFYDLDWYIETRYRKPIHQIFSERGESGFREIEREMLHEAAAFEDIVLSCGGGTPCYFDNIDYMNEVGHTVYLKCSPETLAAHLKMGRSIRPLIQGKTPEELDAFIRESLTQRAPFYEKARIIIDVPYLGAKERVEQIAAVIAGKIAEDKA